MKNILSGFLGIALFSTSSMLASAEATNHDGYIIERETEIATQQPGPHKGGGETTGFSFFADAPSMDTVFKKRILHPGSAIGYHEQHKDEIYYVVSGSGELTMNGQKSEVGPGTAILTRPGNSHGLRQTGKDDLVIFIVYRKHE
ncbi:cupin domain-containing protein [Microbulbifer sp. CAU 1566]|uniref:cupin domain-containing protein n=1 Tax=Microbulbifer sp. CAU 1566 TaxID=2933269 RepID=UPI002005B673|nr:cupin domain-containing protein [Microbulbifer sp. CAU 1566]MCK7596491.1 cupin domain-containing protein [Microbulbifer sp. CAU 1566]